MTRRKSVCTKWTLILLVICSPSVYSRPQDSSLAVVISSTNNVLSEKTGNPLRYSFKNAFNSNKNNLPIIVSFNNKSRVADTKTITVNISISDTPEIIHVNTTRTSRLLRKTYKSKQKPNSTIKTSTLIKSKDPTVESLQYPYDKDSLENKNSSIRKVITKWTDKTKYDDLDLSDDTKASSDKDKITFTEFANNEANSKDQRVNLKNTNIKYNKYYKPQPQYSEETQIYLNNIHLIDHPLQKPLYSYNTYPNPTPVITNVGYPAPWNPQNHRKTTTRKPAPVTEPLKDYNYHNIVDKYPNFEITTFQPSSAYTEKIIIRPEEYSASPDECPTIYLTLNNTFQGQGKEACPDLNIAVNTNVINKNVVIETEEDDTDGIFSGGFDIPLSDDSANDESGNDYFQSEENQGVEDSASVEGTELAYYNTVNAVQADSVEPGVLASPSSHSPVISKPSRPIYDYDDLFSFPSLLDFFQPAVNALGWLASINPLTLSLFPLLLTPIAVLFAGSGIAALFSPWFLPYGREAPEVIHIYSSPLQWDKQLKDWHSHLFSETREVRSDLSKSSKELKNQSSSRETLFHKLQNWMKATSNKFKDIDKDLLSNHKSKRKKRVVWTRDAEQKQTEENIALKTAPPSYTARDVKTKFPIQESIDTVASQLLEKPENVSSDLPVAPDVRIPPKIKTVVNHKHKIKTRNEDEVALDNGHAGEAVPITMDEMESENKITDDTNESSTSNDGISTWILLSNSPNVSSVSTEPTKTQDAQRKQKPSGNKNKTKRPSNSKTPIVKRPATIGSTNKADLVASGSAINENVYNKIKDTVLTNVQKNKSTSTQRTTTSTIAPTTLISTTRKEVTKSSATLTTKRKKNKNKPKSTTTEEPISSDSALLPMEPKEEEIELEISTPATTTKKPKRTTSRKKTKTKKRKTTPKPEETSLTEVKTSNKTKSSKPGKKPLETGAITTQLYNYFSREVMPSVGVGMLGLASLVGIAGYFLYPFSTPVRRTFEVDKKDDIYKYNAEEYASEGNGQAEEEMLGTVLAGMPAHAKQKLNPYAGQTAHINRYQVKKDQNLRYRHVAGYESNYNRYPQQKTGIAHAAVYAKPINYAPQYETRHTYTTESSKYSYEKPQSYTPYPAVEPIYAAPQTGSGITSYGSDDTSSSVVYGVKPSSESEFKPVYPFEAQFYSDSTNNPASPTSMYLGSNNEEQDEDLDNSSISGELNDAKFVVGNVPKELVDTATPAVVPEHGPRKLKKRSISSSLEEILRAEKENKDIFISNEIDDSFNFPIRNLAPINDPLPINDGNTPKDVIPIYAVSVDPTDQKPESLTTSKSELIESVSTLPINTENNSPTTDLSNELDTSTKSFRVYEVFSGDNVDPTKQPTKKESTIIATSTQLFNADTEAGDSVTETLSTIPSLPSVTEVPTSKPESTNNPDIITYPPLNESGGFLAFLKRLVDFKYRLGLSILQTTSDSLNRYLRNIEGSMQKVARASRT